MDSTFARRAAMRSYIRSTLGVGLGARLGLAKDWSLRGDAYWLSQLQWLRSSYMHAVASVPYYSGNDSYPRPSEIHNAIVVESSPYRSLQSAVQLLPILDKTRVRTEGESFRSVKHHRWATRHTTSGTSGSPIELYATIAERSIAAEIRRQWYASYGLSRHPRTINVTGALADGREILSLDRIARYGFISIYNIGGDSASVISDALRNFRPQLLYGYASALGQLAQVVDSRDFRATLAVSTSEILTASTRELIKDNLAWTVADMYGSQEGAHLALECQFGRRHVHPRVGIVEVVDGEGFDVGDGAVGDIVVTSLLRAHMPLLRYKLGDAGIVSGREHGSQCDCGLDWPWISEIVGRSDDLVWLSDGSRVGYLGFHLFKNLRGVTEAQVFQDRVGEAIVRIVPASGFDRVSVEQQVTSEARRRTNARLVLRFEYLDELPRDAGGKVRAAEVRLRH